MMKTAFAAAALIGGLAFTAAPALADEQVADAQKPAALTIDSTIETLMANKKTAAILEKHFPGISQHPAYGQFKGMSLVQLQPWSGGMITDEAIEKVKADLAAMA